MSSVYIISAFILVACIAVCVLFIKQSIEKKQRERVRLSKALEKRAQELVHMIDAFPPQFLPKDITVLIYRCLIDTYEQLTSISHSQEHTSAYQMYCASMEKVITEQTVAQRVDLQNPQQIAQIKQYLNHLAKLLSKLNAKGSIDKQQHGQYHSQLKKLIQQIAVDNYVLAARQAEQVQKTKLALHNFKMAEKVLVQDGVLVQQKQQITSIKEKIAQLNAAIEATQQQPSSAENKPSEPQSADDKDTGNPPKKDAEWKKNNVYD